MAFRIIVGFCKARDLLLNIAFAWVGIGKVWEMDTTDIELISRN